MEANIMNNRSTKKSVGVRLTSEAVELMQVMAKDKGLSQTSVMELAIREMAEREGFRSREMAEAK
jgi:predicted transcriptional regulator